MERFFRLLPVLVAILLAGPVRAAPVGYSDQAAFTTALPGAATTVDFDSESADSLIPPGSSVDGMTFTYALDGVALKVSSESGSTYSTTSPGNFLGTDDADILQDGDEISLSFAPVNALGFYVLSKDALENGDVSLSAGGMTTNLIATEVQGAPLGDGSSVYFLGVIDAANAFSSATISTAGNGEFLFNIDDIVTAQGGDPLTLSLGYPPQNGKKGQFYWWGGLSPAGGVPPYTYSLAGGWIPWPLTLNENTGVIMGMPSNAVTAFFTIRVTDANSATATVQSQIIIAEPGYVCGACHGAQDF